MTTHPTLRALGTAMLLCLLPLSILAQPAPGTCEIGMAHADLDANHVRARLYNNGSLFWRGSGSVYNVPKDGEADAVYTTGLWLGGLVDGELRFAGTLYGPFEYWPGPLTDDGGPPADCTPYDHLWSITRADLDRYDATGEAIADLRDWPAHLGAPVADGDGVPGNYHLATGDRPALEGDQTVWWIMNDAGGTKQWSKRPPIPMEVQVTAWAYDADGPLGYTTFYRYRLTYRGDEPFEDAYAGLWIDPDVGNATDDFVGSDMLRDMGFAYNGDDFDDGFDGYGEAPPAVGFTILKGPVALPDGRDNDRDGAVDEAGERHGMSRFIRWTSDASAHGNPPGSDDTPYRYLRGIWRDGTPMTYGGYGYGGSEETNYMYSGDPVAQAYWSEENIDAHGSRNTPSDRDFLMSLGPFRMEPGETEEVVFAIVWSRGSNRLLSVEQLRRDVDVVRTAFALTSTAVEIPGDLPGRFALHGNYPNPFARETTIPFTLPAAADVTLLVYDLLGREVARLIDGRQGAGRHEPLWRAAEVAAGVYLYRLTAGGEVKTGRLVVIR